MCLIKHKIKEQAVVNILKDHIIWIRVSELVYNIQNIYNPSKKQPFDWDAENNYEGYGTALLLMDISSDEDLCSKIGDITHDAILNSNENAKDLSEQIYVEWLVAIKNHYTKRKEEVIV